MQKHEVAQFLIYMAALIIGTPLLGRWMAKIFTNQETFPVKWLRPIERCIYQLSGVDEREEMSWKEYAVALVIFNGLGFLTVLMLQLLQAHLPFNPQKLPNVPFALALNTATSFVTNTNWQAYSGESTLSYLVQMLGLGVQNFLSAATGIAVFLAMTRGFIRKSASTLGNFWADATKSTLYVLLPLSTIMAVLLVGQGVVQTFNPYATATTLEGASQQIPLGPAASQIAIKQLGTNGGGFFGVNSAHPFENPTPFSNFLEMLAILLIPSALVYTYGIMVGNQRHGWCIWATMLIFFLVGFGISWWAETQYNPIFHTGNLMEGKETRFGVMNSVLWSTATTDASNGSVNSMHDSLSPLAGMVAIFNIMLGEIIFGGVGAGLYGILLHVILTVFIAGLMVGRTPEYLGKKIEAGEVKWTVVAVLAPSIVVLIGTAISCITSVGLSSLANKGAHGLSEMLYAWTSASNNNGSAFAGLNANTPFYNYGLAFAMFVGRFAVIIPVLAIAGNMVQKKIAPPSLGTFPTDGVIFTVLLTSIILIVGGLTFMPVLSLGPIVEHFLMLQGRIF
jgi:K+-transporting ATPase ATPase A chain